MAAASEAYRPDRLRREGSLIETRRRDLTSAQHASSSGVIRHGSANPEWHEFVKKSEQEVVGWFRSWHAQLSAALEREFGKTEAPLDAAELTTDLPRQQQDYLAQLSKAKAPSGEATARTSSDLSISDSPGEILKNCKR